MGILIKNLNELEIKDDYDKKEVMSVLESIYDDWRATEIRNVANGCGRSGMDGMTTQDVWRLFNQIPYKIISIFINIMEKHYINI